MTNFKFNLRNVLAIAICLAATMMFSGCDPDDLNGNTPDTVFNFTNVSNTGFDYSINAITYGKGLFVAVGGLTSSGQDAHPETAWSADGINWTKGVIGGKWPLYDLTYGNYNGGRFVAVSWIQLDYFNGHAEGIYCSDDGKEWTTLMLLPAENWIGISFEGITYGNGKYVAVGNKVNSDYSMSAAILYSTDGENWLHANTSCFNERYNYVYDIHWNGEKFIATANYERLASSTDGINWTIVKGSNGHSSDNANCVMYGGNCWVAGADDNPLYTSPSGNSGTWTTIPNNFKGSVTAITYGAGKFVAGSYGGEIGYSSNGMDWTMVGTNPFRTGNRPQDIIEGIAYGAGRFVVAGNTNTSNTGDGNSKGRIACSNIME